MLHIVPILCLIIFVGFIEFRLKQEFNEIRKEFDNLKRQIDINRTNIQNHIDYESFSGCNE